MDFFSIDFLLRVLIALGLGFLLGLERELTNKYAGLRTHILVCLGACIFTIISIYGFPSYATGDNVLVDQATGIRDTGRVAAQVVSGIGFIGAGNIATAIFTGRNDSDIKLNVEHCKDCGKFYMSYSVYESYREKYGMLLGKIKMDLI